MVQYTGNVVAARFGKHRVYQQQLSVSKSFQFTSQFFMIISHSDSLVVSTPVRQVGHMISNPTQIVTFFFTRSTRQTTTFLLSRRFIIPTVRKSISRVLVCQFIVYLSLFCTRFFRQTMSKTIGPIIIF